MGEIEDLRVFLSVVREASFVGAARALGLPAPSVTRAIAALEDRLGVQLFIRTTRRVSLTPAGATYAERVAPLLAEMERANEELRERVGDTAGLIRLNAPLALGAEMLPEIIAQFRILHPAVNFSVTLSDAFVDSVDDSFDIAIRIARPTREVSGIWRRICRVERVMAASSAYLALHGTPQGPEDLSHHILIAHDPLAHAETWELTKTGPSRAEGGPLPDHAGLQNNAPALGGVDLAANVPLSRNADLPKVEPAQYAGVLGSASTLGDTRSTDGRSPPNADLLGSPRPMARPPGLPPSAGAALPYTEPTPRPGTPALRAPPAPQGTTRHIRTGDTLAANNAALMAGLARQGQGIVLLPRFMLEGDLLAGRLQEILPDWAAPELWLTLYYPPLDRLPARLKLFSDHVEAWVARAGSGLRPDTGA